MNLYEFTKKSNKFIYRFINIKISIELNKIIKIHNIFSRFFPVKNKIYDYIIHVGDNCHTNMNFHKYYRFVDSTLFTWALILDNYRFIEVLNNFNLLFEEDFIYNERLNMWHLKKLNILFHGKHLPDELKNNDNQFDNEKLEAEKKELLERLQYLAKKTNKYLASEGKKLFTRTIIVNDTEKDIDFVLRLYDTLSKRTSNFDLLIIIDKRFNKQFKKQLKKYSNIYIRNVDELPDDFVQRAFLYDYLSWVKIYNEFKPKIIKKSTKTFKYESTD